MRLHAAILVSAFSLQPLAFSQSTAFTYQGHLTATGGAADGLFDLQFSLHNASTGGVLLAGPIGVTSLPVTNGLFTLSLDFGPGMFTGEPRWLDIAVRASGTTNAFVPLTPRQSVAPAPYAMHAEKAAGLDDTLPDAQLSANIPRLNASNNFTGPVTFNPATGQPFSVGSTKKVINLNADQLDGLDSTAFWKTSGNLGTTNGVNFLGTLDL